jgi:nitrogen fixation protein NifX
MKVAFCSSNGAVVDQNFKVADSYSIWDVGPQEAYYISTVYVPQDVFGEEERLTVRADALSDCSIIYASEISGPAAAKLTARAILPLKTKQVVSIEDIICRLQGVMRKSAPRWLVKKMGNQELRHG